MSKYLDQIKETNDLTKVAIDWLNECREVLLRNSTQGTKYPDSVYINTNTFGQMIKTFQQATERLSTIHDKIHDSILKEKLNRLQPNDNINRPAEQVTPQD